MQRQFSLFQSHLDLAHHYWEMILQKGGSVIDATCGNGHDTLKLTQLLPDQEILIGIDIQKAAISQTQEKLKTSLSEQQLSRVHLFCQSHSTFPALCLEHTIKLIVYNLGYLPGSNKKLTTLTHSTLESLGAALELIAPGGAISITCYPGHDEGAKEEEAILQIVAALSPSLWNVCHHKFLNRKHSPSLLLIQKQTQTSKKV